jgi:16S rRNA G966 N2-methylase RsmD
MGHKRDFLFKYVPAPQRSLLKLDEEAAYSVTDQVTADRMTQDLVRVLGPGVAKSATLCDATACIGGNAMSFARAFKHVVAIESDTTRFAYLQHNLHVLGFHNVHCVHGDSVKEVSWNHSTGSRLALRSLRSKAPLYDVIFIDPPWGGPDYKTQTLVSLELSNVPLADLCKEWAPHTRYIAIKTPTNFDKETFTAATAGVLELVHRNVMLRKIHFYVYEVGDVIPCAAGGASPCAAIASAIPARSALPAGP